MTNNMTHSPFPWYYEYSPYTVQAASDTSDPVAKELPAFVVYDAECNKIFDTNEDTPAELQEANAHLASAIPGMLAALQLAQAALNTAPRFRVADTDSYKIAATVDRALAEATMPCNTGGRT
jgi:hypothetical protein